MISSSLASSKGWIGIKANWYEAPLVIGAVHNTPHLPKIRHPPPQTGSTLLKDQTASKLITLGSTKIAPLHSISQGQQQQHPPQIREHH